LREFCLGANRNGIGLQQAKFHLVAQSKNEPFESKSTTVLKSPDLLKFDSQPMTKMRLKVFNTSVNEGFLIKWHISRDFDQSVKEGIQ